jgi:SAM-dependent methyltransferase
MQSDEYTGFFAEFYDLLHAGNSDAKVYPRLLKPYGEKVLELGCGTGRIAIPLAEAGFTVTGLEYAKDMIALLKKKPYPHERLHVIWGDARDFTIPDTFDVILLNCNFINHFMDSADIVRILLSCKRHLNKAGVIIVDCSAPDAAGMLKSDGIEEMFEFQTPKGTVIKDFFCPRYDFLQQMETDTIRLEEYEGKALIRQAEAQVVLTYYFPREIRGIIREAGLCIAKESGWLWDGGQSIPIGPEAGEMVFFCSIP